MALSGPFRLRDLVRDKTGFTVRQEVPTGVLYPYAGTSAPSGYLLCDGSPLSTTTYSALFAVIQYTYGGSGGTFNLPDLRGRMPVGAGTGEQNGVASTGKPNGGTVIPARTIGQFGGDSRMPSHNHGGTSGTMSANSTHFHAWTRAAYPYADSGAIRPATFQYGVAGATGVEIQTAYSDTRDINHSHSIPSDGSGAASAGNMPPFIVTNYIIKV